jgi:hypothetical protein
MTSPRDGFAGTTVLVVGSEDAIRKQLYTIAFTKKSSIEDIKDTSKFTPRVLLGTSGCIGTGLDGKDVYLVICRGLPTSLLHLIQEMGHCGRNSSMNSGIQSLPNCYHVMFTIHDYVYLTERLYFDDIEKQEGEEDNDDDDTTTEDNNDEDDCIIISKNDEIMMHRHNLDNCLSLFCLSMGCWHKILERECGNPFSFSAGQVEQVMMDNCNANCPRCDGSMDAFIKPIIKTGLMSFLAEAFGDMYTGSVTPVQLSKQLFDFKDVGSIVYKRSKSNKAESIRVTQLTIM